MKLRNNLLLISASLLLLVGCSSNGEDTEGQTAVSSETEKAVESTSIIVAESAEETAENVADKYNYEMVEPVPNDTEFGIVDYWEFDDKHVVYANPEGGIMHVGGAGLTKEEAEELINNENFPITEELQSILDATSFDDFYDDGVPSEYYNNYNGLTLAVSPQITSDDEVLFVVLFSIKP